MSRTISAAAGWWTRARRTAALGLGAVAVAGLSIVGAGTASAAPGHAASPAKAATSAAPVSSPATVEATPRNGVCEVGEFCLYWGSGLTGSVSDFTTSVANYGTTQPTCFDFKGPGAGQGQCIKNNAESAWNRSSRNVEVFFNSNFGGDSDIVPAGDFEDLILTFNENASHKFE